MPRRSPNLNLLGLKLPGAGNNVSRTRGIPSRPCPKKAHIIPVLAILIIPNKTALPWPAGLQLYCGYYPTYSKQRGLHSTRWNGVVKRKPSPRPHIRRPASERQNSMRERIWTGGAGSTKDETRFHYWSVITEVRRTPCAWVFP